MSTDTNNSEEKDGNYDSIRTDAVALLQLINKYVKVQLIRNTEFVGFVHSIDPVQYSIILLSPEKDSYTINVIPGHAILNVVETYPVPNNKPIAQKMATQAKSNDNDIKKQRLITWFKKNLLPIAESEEKILFGNVSILPPYGVSNICTDNLNVAKQLRKIIESMPEDFDPN